MSKTEQFLLQRAFNASNAIVSLSFGRPPSVSDFDLQERVIQGELTFDQAVQVVVARALTQQQSAIGSPDEQP